MVPGFRAADDFEVYEIAKGRRAWMRVRMVMERYMLHDTSLVLDSARTQRDSNAHLLLMKPSSLRLNSCRD